MAKIKTIEIVDIENVRNEKLRYQNNTLAYWLGLLACVVSLFAGLVGLNTMKASYWTVVKILINVVILLLGFASAENIKHYSQKASYVFFIFAVVNILRIFWFPVQMFRWYKKYLDEGDTSILNDHFSKVVQPGKSDAARGYLPASGYWRATFMIIFLILSSVLFAFAGYVGLVKTLKLKRYLKSINVEM